MKTTLRIARSLTAALLTFGSLAGGANAATIGIRSGNAAEQAQITSTLTDLGHTVVLKSAGDYSGIDVFLSYASIGGEGPSAAQVSSGLHFIQISDHGGNSNSGNPAAWNDGVNPNPHGTLYDLQTVGIHPLLTNVDPSFDALGFWHYGITSGSNWLGNVTNGTGLMDSSGFGINSTLAYQELGSGRTVYIGWNVYGTDADVNSLTVLDNAIQWTTTGSVVPEPTSTALLAFGLLSFSFRRSRR